jgi:hypothetical protein
MGRRHCIVLGLAVVAWLAAACVHPAVPPPITRERAIQIARGHVTFQPSSVGASMATSAGRDVWRITLRGRLPGQPPLLFETVIVEVDRRSGEVVSVARS